LVFPHVAIPSGFTNLPQRSSFFIVPKLPWRTLAVTILTISVVKSNPLAKAAQAHLADAKKSHPKNAVSNLQDHIKLSEKRFS